MTADSSEEPTDFLPTSGNAAELGLASVIMGATLFLASPMTLVLAVLVWQFADQEPGVVRLHAWLARIGVSIAFLTAVASTAFAITSIRSGMRHRQPTGLGFAGLVLNLAALALWVVTAIGLLNVTESLLFLHGR